MWMSDERYELSRANRQFYSETRKYLHTLENTKPSLAGEVSEPRHITACKLNCGFYYNE